MLKVVIFVPDQREVIEAVMSAASDAGAGVIGNYTGCGYYSKGTGNWRSGEGSHPTVGAVGTYSHEPEVRIEMICPNECASEIKQAIKSIHPYEEPEIDFMELVEVE